MHSHWSEILRGYGCDCASGRNLWMFECYADMPSDAYAYVCTVQCGCTCICTIHHVVVERCSGVCLCMMADDFCLQHRKKMNFKKEFVTLDWLWKDIQIRTSYTCLDISVCFFVFVYVSVCVCVLCFVQHLHIRPNVTMSYNGILFVNFYLFL